MDLYPRNKVSSGYNINVQYEGGADGFTKQDEDITCCLCIPAVTGFKVLTVLTGLGAIGSYGMSLIPFILMILWWMDADSKKGRQYLYVSQIINLVVTFITMFITIAAATAAITYATQNMTEE